MFDENLVRAILANKAKSAQKQTKPSYPVPTPTPKPIRVKM